MARVHLVRHGRASAGFDAGRDPGLDEIGRAEAAGAAATLAPLGPLPVITSPLRRCRDTAAPLARRWGVEPTVDPAVSEVAAPTDDLAERGEWLRAAMAGTWAALEEPPRAWRRVLLDRVLAVEADSVVVTHFMAINAVLGACAGDDRVVQGHVANGAITVVEVDAGGLELVSAGDMGESRIL